MLASNLVAKANDKALKNDKTCARFFEYVGALTTYVKSESDKLIKPQIVIFRITAPEVCRPKDYETVSVSEFSSPIGTLQSETDFGSSDIYEDDLINRTEDLVAEENYTSDVQLKNTKVLEVTGTIKSEDDSIFP